MSYFHLMELQNKQTDQFLTTCGDYPTETMRNNCLGLQDICLAMDLERFPVFMV